MKDMNTGSIAAEIKNTSFLSLLKDSLDCKSVTTITSNNLFTQQFLLSHPSLKGVKFDVVGSTVPQGPSTLKLGFDATQGIISASTYIDLMNGPVATASVSTKVKDFLVGADVGYDVATGRVDKYTASIALDRPREKVVLQMYHPQCPIL